MIETALVYIFARTEEKPFIGCGAFVEGGFVATCRHVWDFATEDEEARRTHVIVEFPNADFEGASPTFTASLVPTRDERNVDLALLSPEPTPQGPMPLPVARHKDYTTGDAYTIPFLRSRCCSSEIHGMISRYRPKEKPEQEFSSTDLGKYWFEEGSSGAPVFLKPRGMHLAGILTRAELPGHPADRQAGSLREAFIIPGDIIWTHVATAIAERVPTPTEEPVPSASLRKLLEDLGHHGVAASDIPSALADAFAAMKATAHAPVDPSNLGRDIDKTIAAARVKLDALDPQAALDILRRKRETTAAVRHDAVQREVALLVEQTRIQRLSLDHFGALKTLEEILRIHPRNAWALIECGDIKIVVGDRVSAAAFLQRAMAIAEESSDRALIALAHTLQGDLCIAEGDRSDALDAYNMGLNIRCELARLDPESAQLQHDLLVSHVKIGDVRVAMRDLSGALDAYNKVVEIAQDLARRDPGNAQWQRDLSISYTNIGHVCAAQGDQVGALDAYSKDLVITDDLVRRDPANMQWQRDLSISHLNIGDTRVAEKDWSSALEAYDKGLTIANYLTSRDPLNTHWQRGVSTLYERVGDVRVAKGDLSKALDAYRESHAIVEDLSRRDPENAQWQRDLSTSHMRIGDIYAARGNRSGALDSYRKDLAIAEKLVRHDPADAQWQRDVAVSLCRIADLGVDALPNWRRAVDILEALQRTEKFVPDDLEWLKDVRRRLADAS